MPKTRSGRRIALSRKKMKELLAANATARKSPHPLSPFSPQRAALIQYMRYVISARMTGDMDILSTDGFKKSEADLAKEFLIDVPKLRQG